MSIVHASIFVVPRPAAGKCSTFIASKHEVTRNRRDTMPAKDRWNHVRLLDESIDLVRTRDKSLIKKASKPRKLHCLDKKTKPMQKAEAEYIVCID